MSSETRNSEYNATQALQWLMEGKAIEENTKPLGDYLWQTPNSIKPNGRYRLVERELVLALTEKEISNLVSLLGLQHDTIEKINIEIHPHEQIDYFAIKSVWRKVKGVVGNE